MTGRRSSPDPRKARLAEALRRNLRRRKAQGRARRDAGDGTGREDDAQPAPRDAPDTDTETD
jgi:hypothetical protein